jgi:UDP-N-acetylmuramoylalanine-D-glutamate ligase
MTMAKIHGTKTRTADLDRLRPQLPEPIGSAVLFGNARGQIAPLLVASVEQLHATSPAEQEVRG